MKRLLFIFLMVMSSIQSSAQPLWINGYIFYKENDQIKTIPLATVKWYEYNPKGEKSLMYARLTDLSGEYQLAKDVPYRDRYYVEVSAPGFKTKKKVMGDLPTDMEGNLTLHFELERTGAGSLLFSQYDVKEHFESCQNMAEILAKIPFATMNDDYSLTDKAGRSLKVFLNGYSVPDEALSNADKIPAEALESVEFYDLNQPESADFGGAVNFVLMEGPYANDELDFVPIENEGFAISVVE